MKTIDEIYQAHAKTVYKYLLTHTQSHDLAEELKALDGPIFLVGDGSILTHTTLKDAIPHLVLPPEHRMHQRASGVALAAARKIKANESGDGAALTPNYLRLSQAERVRMEKLNK